MATAVSAIPLERSLSKMEAKAEGTPDLYADYKLKQREHEFLKIQVGDRAASATPACASPPRALLLKLPWRGTENEFNVVGARI